MLSTQNISCLLLVVALSAKADAYGRRKKVAKVDKFDVRGGREASVEDFDTSDQPAESVEKFDVEVFDVSDFDTLNRPSVEDFDGKQSAKIGVNKFWATNTPNKEKTKRRALGSWSSWTFSQRPNFNFPRRNRVKTKESPRNSRKSSMTMPNDNFGVKRIVIFPCQDQNLRC